MTLVPPATNYKDTFLEALKESMVQDKEHAMKEDINVVAYDFDFFVKCEIEKAQGLHLPLGYIPETVLWLIDNDEYIGQTGIRHYLTEKLLREGGHIGYYIRPSKRKMGYGTKILHLALQEAKKMGIQKALVTCNETNVGSRKIIEANGGILDTNMDDAENNEVKILHFWVSLS